MTFDGGRGVVSNKTAQFGALLLDLDGTLADSLQGMFRAYEAFLLSHGARPSEEEFGDLNGPPLADVVERLRVTHDLGGSPAALSTAYEQFVDRAYEDVAPRDGAEPLLAAARRAACRVGIVTSNGELRTWAWLSRTGLQHSVDFVVAAEHVRRGKPDPEPYQVGVRLCGLPSTHVIAVEDSHSGATAAMLAGLETYLLCPVGSLEPTDLPGVRAVSSLHEVRRLLWPT